MIVSFSVANFRSFFSEETFSLVASNRLSSHAGHLAPIPNSSESVLRAAVIYGANGAGKSNLFKALKYVEHMALSPRTKNEGTGRTAFRFGPSESQESSFDLQFIAGGKLYRFGFKVDDNRVTEEWLAEILGTKEKTLYERVTDSSGDITIDAQGLRDVGEKLMALSKVGGPQNQLFLATIDANLEAPDLGEHVSNVIEWFRSDLKLIAPDEALAPIGAVMVDDADFLNFAGEFLRSSSTGVDHLRTTKTELTQEELRDLLPKSLTSKVLKDLAGGGIGKAVITLSGGNDLLIERKDQTHFYTITIQAAHKNTSGTTVQLDLSEESDGTQRLLNLLPALSKLDSASSVYFIDEIDRSLHPILVWKFLDFFLKSCHGGKSQIILTTHESNLLDLELLRRDEIWFAEKDNAASTRLYSLMDFKVRKDHEIRKHYLQGRFGAVPFLGNLDCLMAERDEKNGPHQP